MEGIILFVVAYAAGVITWPTVKAIYLSLKG